MNKRDLARRLARESHRSNGQAADDVDKLVYKMLKDLKRSVRKPALPPEKASQAPVGSVRKDES